MSEQVALLPGFLTAHLQLSLAALLLGVCLSVPLGILVSRRRGLEPGVLGLASVIQTVPSLALLAIMVPLLGVLGGFAAAAFGVELRSIGFLPAWLALSLYSLLPMLRNTVTGIAGVDASLIEAAQGVGMTPRQQLLRVELPLAMPVIVAGLRTATVWVVGTATLSTPVGATSLGNFIFSGLQTRNQAAVLVGCVSAAGLALLLDAIIRGLEVGLRERRRRATAASALALLALCLYTLGATAASLRGGGAELVRIGSKTFSEQYILSELLARHVADATGLRSEAIQSLGSTVLFDALAADEIDVYVDYSGTIWATIMRRQGLPGDRAEVLREVRRYLRDEHGIVLAAALGFENTYALAMRGEQAAALGVSRLSQLGAVSPRLEIGGDYEFFQRAEWFALEGVYDLVFRNERAMDSALMYQAIERGEVDVISAYSTDGRIAALGLELLEDDRGVIPPYDAIVLVAPRLARERPDVVAALARLEGAIDAAAMQRMNGAVDSQGRSPRGVALDFLRTLERP